MQTLAASLALTSVVVVVGAVALVAPSSASAQATASPSPSPTASPSRFPCGQPDQHSVSADPTSISSGSTTTVTVVRRLEPCYSDESRSHEVTLYARPAGTQAEPTVVATGHTDSQGRVEFVHAPAQTIEYSDAPDLQVYANGPRVVQVTVDGRTPTPSPTPVHGDCRAGAQVTLDRATIIATGSATVTVREIPHTVVDLFGYTRPSTEYRLVRSERTNADGIATFTIRPPANTRLKAAQREEDCTDPVFGTEPSVVLNVRTALTLTAERNGVRDYTFAGDSLPARPGGLIVSLYRVTDSGRQVLTAQARADAQNGEWTINRRFAGTGRFGFVARTGQDLQNAPGVSNTRSTLVY
jgi:hypothetical protein